MYSIINDIRKGIYMNQLMEYMKRKLIRYTNQGLNFRRRRNRIQAARVKSIAVFAVEIAALILFAFFLVFSFGRKVEVAGESMKPTILNGDTVLVNRLVYVISSPKKNDVVAFLPSGNLSAKYSVKRVIGVPGDKIQIKNGYVYINDEAYDDVVLNADSIKDAGLAKNEMILGKDEYFLLGDNRNNSEDSRYATIGNVSKNEIFGKTWIDVSFGRFGLL